MKPNAWSVVVTGIVLLACTVGGQVDGAAPSTAGSCPDGTRLFNGACRLICSTAKGCASGQECVSVDKTPNAGALCLPSVDAAECVYLGDDTQCVASGGRMAYGARGTAATYIAYASTPGADPSDVTGHNDPYFYSPYGGGVAAPCAGNAEYIAEPAAGPLACSGTHTVKRCRLQYDQCVLVTGTTREFVQP